jgi:tRNA(Ile)-lysidine synthase
MSLETHMLAQMQSYANVKRWVVAYSGGLDSSVLLYLTNVVNRQLDKPKNICALHVNHGLSKNAKAWQSHCQQIAESNGLSFFSQSVVIDKKGEGLEAAARDARYGIFEKFIQPDDCLLMAHHSDDQAETFLLRLLRGAGVLGLGAMPKLRSLGKGQLLRPLLNQSRQVLEDYAKENQIKSIDDESNLSLDYDRNYLRHQIIPLLEKRWPSTSKKITSAVEHLQKSQHLLNELAVIDLENTHPKNERYGKSIDWSVLNALSLERRNNLLRYWSEMEGYALPDIQQLEQINQQFFSQNAMLTSALVSWGDCEIRQFNKRLFLLPRLQKFESSKTSLDWNINEEIHLGGIVRLSAQKQSDSHSALIAINKLAGQTLSVRWRQGGERCKPKGRSASQTIKKLLQEYQLETWLRDRVPLIYCGDELVAVGDLWVCEEFAVEDMEEGLQIYWQLV